MRNYNFDFRRMLCEATVDRALRDIQRDTKRSLRNLVDLALNFTNGQYLHSILEVVQTMLNDEQSAYFEAMQLAIQNVDTETLKTFGLNLGLESFTRGAKRIRTLEESCGYNIPWALTICAGREGVDLSDCLHLVSEGMELGIYVYLLRDYGMDGESLQILTSQYPKCAFILLTDRLCTQENDMSWLRDLHNIMYLIDADQENKEQSLACLRANLCLYGLYRWYGSENAHLVVAEAALEAYRDDSPLSVCLIPRKDTSPEIRSAVGSRVLAVRDSLLYPYFAMEFSGDLLAIDTAVSGDCCALAVCPNGQVSTIRKGWLSGDEFSIHHSSLQDILRRAVPKLHP